MPILYPDFENSTVPLYHQLYSAIKHSVNEGILASGEKLPSIRKLSEELKLSRTTIENAYQQLCIEGYLINKPQSGYYTADLSLGHAQLKKTDNSAVNVSIKRDYSFIFSTSSVDPNAFRVDLWRRYLRNVLNEPDGLFSYGESQGEYSLRKTVSEYCTRVRGVISTPERIVIGAGIQPLLQILCGLLQSSVDSIGMETPFFEHARQIFSDCSLNVLPIPADKDGASVEYLRKNGIRCAYINPSAVNDSGSPMPMKRRLEFIDWTAEGGILIEDDNNGELRYGSRPVPAIQGLAPDRNIVYLGTFSKVLMPAVRISYMVLPEELAKKYVNCRKNYNQTASKTEQLALAQYIREGHLERQLRKMRKIYSRKGELLIECLQKYFPNAQITLQETALRVLLRPFLNVDSATLVKLAEASGIYVKAYGKNENGQVSIGFSGIAQEQIADGIKSLHNAWKSLANSQSI